MVKVLEGIDKILAFNPDRELVFNVNRTLGFNLNDGMDFDPDRKLEFDADRTLSFGERGIKFRKRKYIDSDTREVVVKPTYEEERHRAKKRNYHGLSRKEAKLIKQLKDIQYEYKDAESIREKARIMETFEHLKVHLDKVRERLKQC